MNQETLLKKSTSKRKKQLLSEMNTFTEAAVALSPSNLVSLGICSTCSNNNECVWLQNHKIECEEFK